MIVVSLRILNNVSGISMVMIFRDNLMFCIMICCECWVWFRVWGRCCRFWFIRVMLVVLMVMLVFMVFIVIFRLVVVRVGVLLILLLIIVVGC